MRSKQETGLLELIVAWLARLFPSQRAAVPIRVTRDPDPRERRRF